MKEALTQQLEYEKIKITRMQDRNDTQNISQKITEKMTKEA